MSSIYYTPGDHGLSVFDELNEDDLSYEFHMLVVWLKDTGELVWAEDSG